MISAAPALLTALLVLVVGYLQGRNLVRPAGARAAIGAAGSSLAALREDYAHGDLTLDQLEAAVWAELHRKPVTPPRPNPALVREILR